MAYEGTPRDGWVAKASADNALATATRAAETGKRHYITGVDASFSAAAAFKLLQVKDGATVIWEGYVSDAREVSFGEGLQATIGNAVSAELAASGLAGTLGKVNLRGFTG